MKKLIRTNLGISTLTFLERTNELSSQSPDVRHSEILVMEKVNNNICEYKCLYVHMYVCIIIPIGIVPIPIGIILNKYQGRKLI